MSQLNIKERLEELYENINKEEKKENNKVNYSKILNLINNFKENLDKEKKKFKKTFGNEVIEDVTESLKIINDAYQKKIKDNFFLEKEKMIEKFYMEKKKTFSSKIEDSMVEINNNGDEIDEFEIYEPPIIKEINEECDKIQNILMNNESKEDNNSIEKLKLSILQVKDEVNKLKPIDNEVIKRLNEQINAIRKESDKIHKILKIKKKGTFSNIS
jgi:hypothetical protein